MALLKQGNKCEWGTYFWMDWTKWATYFWMDQRENV